MEFKSRLIQSLISHCENIKASCSLFNKDLRKSIGGDLIALYMYNLEFVFKNNIETISEASAFHANDRILSAYFHLKWDEEKGHDQWAKNDLEKLKQNFKLAKSPYVLPEMEEFVLFLKRTMKSNPLMYVTYFFHAEFMTAYLGPEWMEIVESVLGIKKPEISALSNHIELDDGHADEAISFLEQYGLTPVIEDEVIDFTSELHKHYTNFFEALALAGGMNESKSFRESA